MPRHCFALFTLFLSMNAIHAADPTPLRFKTQEIEKSLKIGYAVTLADLNEDRKPDIVVVDKHRVVWYENPTWKMRTILEGTTKPDNVCIAPIDIDGDGKLDLVLGADWAPFNTKAGGTLQWLKRGKTIDDPWTMHAIGEEPTVHRVRVADLDGDGKPSIILVPLMGRESTKEANWMNGRPVRFLEFPIPSDPIKGPWTPNVIDETLHVVHNFAPIPAEGRKGNDIIAASYEGVSLIRRNGDKWQSLHIGEGNQANPKSNRGASEIKQGKLKDGTPYIATVEPWHGNQIVVYTPPEKNDTLWKRHVIDEQLKWGHGVWCADLDGDGGEELVIGVRDDLSQNENERRGVRIYTPIDAKAGKWHRQIVESGGVAVEDLAVTDLDGDGKPDIVAVGRQTFNARIYWNQGR